MGYGHTHTQTIVTQGKYIINVHTSYKLKALSMFMCKICVCIYRNFVTKKCLLHIRCHHPEKSKCVRSMQVIHHNKIHSLSSLTTDFYFKM